MRNSTDCICVEWDGIGCINFSKSLKCEIISHTFAHIMYYEIVLCYVFWEGGWFIRRACIDSISNWESDSRPRHLNRDDTRKRVCYLLILCMFECNCCDGCIVYLFAVTPINRMEMKFVKIACWFILACVRLQLVSAPADVIRGHTSIAPDMINSPLRFSKSLKHKIIFQTHFISCITRSCYTICFDPKWDLFIESALLQLRNWKSDSRPSNFNYSDTINMFVTYSFYAYANVICAMDACVGFICLYIFLLRHQWIGWN